MKKLVTIILILLMCFGLYKIYATIVDVSVKNTKDRIEDIDKAKKLTAELNTQNYIKSVEASLINSLFDGDIIDGTYRVENNKIINEQDENIFYEISYKGELPTNDSKLEIKENSITNATIYMGGYKIQYNEIAN